MVTSARPVVGHARNRQPAKMHERTARTDMVVVDLAPRARFRVPTPREINQTQGIELCLCD